MTKKVQVLLSSYNGEKYIEEQIKSLLDQDYPNLHILIRDDGSTDKTLEILDKYRTYPHIRVIRGENVGVIKSFFSLLQESDEDADFFAFCDQDDVWLRDKVSRAITLLSKEDSNIPLMYCSRLTIVDENLNVLRQSKTHRRKPAFANSLVQNIAVGCTMIINKRCRMLLCKEFPSKVRMHDFWIYQVTSGTGKVIFDHESRILYRQHSSNAVGAKIGLWKKWKGRMLRYADIDNRHLIRLQARELQRIFHHDLTPNNQRILSSFLILPNGFVKRLFYVLRSEIYRQSKLDSIIFKLMILFNKI
jgi:glycosyltransferase involved in cell wall biosynthesis